MPPAIIDAIERQRRALLAADEAMRREMARQWLEVERGLRSQVDALTLELAARPGSFTRLDLMRVQRYQELQVQISREMTRYTGYVNTAISEQQRALAQLALEHSTNAIRTVAADARVAASFNQLPVAAVENMIGLAGDGSPLRAILADASTVGPDALAQELVRGMALGLNPREMARRAIRDGLGRSLTRMETIARTEALRSYREASRQNYLASNVVKGYKRICAKGPRTCIACLALDGTFYPLDVPFVEHVNGRCTLVPVLTVGRETTWRSGRDWFERQPEPRQREMMGPARFELWKSGQVSWADMAAVEHDPVWGGSPRVVSVGELQRLTQ